jgi:hypothetical protein
VQFLHFATGGATPVAIGVDLPTLQLEENLTADQQAALAEDLAS